MPARFRPVTTFSVRQDVADEVTVWNPILIGQAQSNGWPALTDREGLERWTKDALNHYLDNAMPPDAYRFWATYLNKSHYANEIRTALFVEMFRDTFDLLMGNRNFSRADDIRISNSPVWQIVLNLAKESQDVLRDQSFETFWRWVSQNPSAEPKKRRVFVELFFPWSG